MAFYLDVDTLVERVSELQPLPEAARRVIELAEDPSSSAGELAGVIASDQALTAKLLRLANSAYYGLARGVATVREAVVVLGMREVRSMALAVSVVEMFGRRSSEPFNTDLFWGHALGVALVAETMAKVTGYCEEEEAYTAGLLHDIGKVVLNQYMPRDYGVAVETALEHGAPIYQAEQRMFGFTHAVLGARLAERWAFPPSLVAAIGEHHRVNLSPERTPLAYVTARANALCHQHGLYAGFEYRQPPEERFAPEEGDPVRESVLQRLGGMEGTEARAREFLASTTRRAFTWYRHATPTPGDAAKW